MTDNKLEKAKNELKEKKDDTIIDERLEKAKNRLKERIEECKKRGIPVIDRHPKPIVIKRPCKFEEDTLYNWHLDGLIGCEVIYEDKDEKGVQDDR